MFKVSSLYNYIHWVSVSFSSKKYLPTSLTYLPYVLYLTTENAFTHTRQLLVDIHTQIFETSGLMLVGLGS